MSTLKKVEKALDLRFEKDSSLYISKEDTEKVKEALFKSNYQNIKAFTDKLGNKTIVQVIIKHNWLIDFNHENQKNLRRIFDRVDSKFLKNISKDIVKDRIFSTTEFKSFIEGYYLQSVKVKKCNKIYSDKNQKIENRVICFERYLKEEYIENSSLSNSIRFINQELNNYPDIYNFLQNKKIQLLANVFRDIEDKEVITQWIIENKIMDKEDRVWHTLFTSMQEEAFYKSVEHIIMYPRWDNEISKHLITKVLKSFIKIEEFNNEIIKIYKNAWELRFLLIRMLEPPKFKNKELANNLINEFEIIGIQDKSQRSVETIRNWQEKKAGFTSVDELLENIHNGNQNFSNIPTLDYYARQLKNTNIDVIIDVYEIWSDDKNIKMILSYYLVNFLRRKEIPSQFHTVNDAEYIIQIALFLDKLNIRSTFAKKFLEQHGQYELLMKMSRR